MEDTEKTLEGGGCEEGFYLQQVLLPLVGMKIDLVHAWIY